MRPKFLPRKLGIEWPQWPQWVLWVRAIVRVHRGNV
jgi:hypothetical protein